MNTDRLREHLFYSLHDNSVSHAYIIEGSGSEAWKAPIYELIYCLSHGIENPDRIIDREILGENQDVIFVTHEKANIISVDEIRKQLVDNIYIKPYAHPYKFYVINDAELMNIQAQNALLKSLEEPPEYSVIFLLTDSAEALLPTIRSRAVYLIADTACGNTLPDIDGAADFLTHIDSVTSQDCHEMVKKVIGLVKNNGITYKALFDLLKKWFRDVLILKNMSKTDLLIYEEYKEDIKRLSNVYSTKKLLDIEDAIIETETRIKLNVGAETALFNMFIMMKID